jgi:hypothetical protein
MTSEDDPKTRPSGLVVRLPYLPEEVRTAAPADSRASCPPSVYTRPAPPNRCICCNLALHGPHWRAFLADSSTGRLVETAVNPPDIERSRPICRACRKGVNQRLFDAEVAGRLRIVLGLVSPTP